MPAEAPYTEVLDSVAANSPEAPSSLSSADVSLPHSTISSTSSSGEKPSSFSPSSVPHNLRPNTLNATKDMYWFAHTGESSHQESRTDGEGSPVRSPRNGEQQAATGSEAAAGAGDAAAAAGVSSPDSVKTTPGGRGALSPGHSDSYWFAHAGGYDTATPSVDLASDSGFSESKEDNSPQALRDRELRLRHYKEVQEEDRLRRLTELQSASLLAQRFREQQEEERKRKIEELRSRDVERRQAVEERKRLIWEAEQERKEAILRRNLDREAKIEARRNAHRNSMSFAFGSSTPRELDLPLGASPTAGMTASRGVTFGSMMAFPVGNHPSDLYKKRTPSADVLDKKSDLSPSFHENSTNPTVQMRAREPDYLFSQYNRRSFSGMSSEATRACLTIPEYYPLSLSPSSPAIVQAPSTTTYDSHSDNWLFGFGVGDPMTRSLVILPSNRGRRKTDLTPTIPWERESALRSHSPGTIAGIAGGGPQAKRAVSMSRLDILAQPRRRPSANMDPSAPGANIMATSMSSSMVTTSKSVLNLAKTPAFYSSKGSSFGGGRNTTGLAKSKGGGMSRSMMHIARTPNVVVARKPPVVATPAVAIPAVALPPSRPLNRSSKLLSQSMCQLAGSSAPLPPPRPTRASRLRATAMASGVATAQTDLLTGATFSMVDRTGYGIRLPISEGLLKDSQSPSRPRSSQSMASELSVASTVSMRSQSGPRRPRPISIAGSIVPANIEQGQVMHPLPPQRRSRTSERKVPIPPPTRPPRAKSVGNDVLVPAAPAGSPKTPASAASRKPPVAPKPGPMIKPEAAPLPQMAKEVEPPILAAPTTTPPELEVPKEPEKMEETSPEPPLLPELSAIIPEPSLISEPQEKQQEEEQQPAPEEQQPQQELPPPPPQQATVVPVSTNSEDKEGPQPVGKAPRITSEEEAKAALAEKRRLAREQAEREAELERQRQEELRRQEEERIRLEEEEQQRFEEEQLRLIQELRLQEEEKLRKAIEEQQKKEEEEKVRKEEEVKLRAEKEEQDRKLKEEAERQKKEMEEKLKREEADRAERKKRVEQIMKRTRTKNEGTPQKADETQKPVEGGTVEPESNKVPLLLDVSQETDDLVSTDTDSRTVDDLLQESDKLPNNIVPQEESQEDDKTSETVKKVNGVENILDSEVMVVTASTELLAMQNGFQGDFVITQNGVSGKAKAPSNSEDVSPQTNGYSSHDVSFSEISPDEKTQPDLGPLLDFDSIGGGSSIVVQVQRGLSPPPPPTDFDQLIDLSLGSANQNEMNRLNNSDELNSNRVPANPFTAFEESVTRKQESTITDLLA